MSACNDDVLSAIQFYMAVKEGNDVNQRHIMAESNAGGVGRGLLTLVGSCLATMAAKYGATEDELLETLLATYLSVDALDRDVS